MALLGISPYLSDTYLEISHESRHSFGLELVRLNLRGAPGSLGASWHQCKGSVICGDIAGFEPGAQEVKSTTAAMHCSRRLFTAQIFFLL